MKLCLRCGVFIIKMDDGLCNYMICVVCGVEFCWLCMKEILDFYYLRYFIFILFLEFDLCILMVLLWVLFYCSFVFFVIDFF